MKEGSQITDPAWITASKIMYHYLEVSDITLAKNMIGNQDPETEGGQVQNLIKSMLNGVEIGWAVSLTTYPI